MNIHPPGSLIAERYEVASHPMMGGMDESALKALRESVQRWMWKSSDM